MVVVAIGHEMAHHVLQDFWAGSVHDLGTWSAHDIGAGINWEKEVLGGMLCGAWAQGRHGRFHCLEDLFWEHRTQPEMLRILGASNSSALSSLPHPADFCLARWNRPRHRGHLALPGRQHHGPSR